MKDGHDKEYIDSGTAHRCFGCGASVHARSIPNTWDVEYVCDRTGLEVHDCKVIIYP